MSALSAWVLLFHAGCRAVGSASAAISNDMPPATVLTAAAAQPEHRYLCPRQELYGVRKVANARSVSQNARTDRINPSSPTQ